MTKLIHAIQDQNFELVKALIKQGEDINAEDEELMTPLRAACHGDLKILQYLIDQHADINMINYNGNTVLNYACTFLDAEQAIQVVDLLCKNHADVHVKDFQSHSPIIKALYNKPNYDLLVTLINHGAYLTDLYNGLTVFEFLEKNHPDIAKKLEKTNKAFVKQQNLNEKFLSAIYDGKISEMENLVNKGADLYYRTQIGVSAFLAATDSIETTNFFLDHGVDVNTQDNIGNTMLMKVFFGRKNTVSQVEMIDFLMSKGANINQRNYRGETPILKALEYPTESKAIEKLLSYMPDLTICDYEGNDVIKMINRRSNSSNELVKSLYEEQMLEKQINDNVELPSNSFTF